MKNVFQALVISTVASVMFSCSDNDLTSLPTEELQKGKLHVDVKSNDNGANATPSSDATINNLHLFVFKNKQGQDDHGAQEIYQSKDFSVENTLSIFSSEPTKGYKDLVVVANHVETKVGEFSELKSLSAFYTQKAFLSNQSEGSFTMVGEQRFEVRGGLNEATINLTRLVAKVVLKSVNVVDDQKLVIEPKRAFMMNVNGVSWLRGTSTGSSEYNDPIFNGYKNEDAYKEGYLTQLSSVLMAPANSSIFYAFENTGKTDKTILVIEANYTKKDGVIIPVYYSIVVKTGKEEAILRNNVYTLSATIKRPGSLHPEIPSDHGDLEVSITVDPWEINDEQEESFE